MKKRAALTILASAVQLLVAAQSHGQFATSCEHIQSLQHSDLFVATVVSVEDSGATNGNPPRVVLDVKRVLRGSLPTGEIKVRWYSAASPIWCPVGEEKAIAIWNATPIAGPRPGARLLISGQPYWSGGYMVEGWCAKPASRRAIRKARFASERRRKVEEEAIPDRDRLDPAM